MKKEEIIELIEKAFEYGYWNREEVIDKIRLTGDERAKIMQAFEDIKDDILQEFK